MKLTGKALNDFEKWYRKEYCKPHWILRIFTWLSLRAFYVDTLSEQFGVLEDWFDSVGMQLYIKPISSKEWSVYIDDFGHHILTSYLVKSTRSEARTAAIEKANDIYNNQP